MGWFNLHLFCDKLDSGKLEQAIDIVRQMGSAGVFGIHVSGPGPDRRAELRVEPGALMSIDIDLAKLDEGAVYKVGENGYVTFCVLDGAGGFRVRLKAQDGSTFFDNRELGADDQVALILGRPGEYMLTEDASNARGTVIVTFPTVARFATAQSQGVRRVKIVGREFHVENPDAASLTSSIGVTATQPLVVRGALTKTRIKAELTKPYETRDDEIAALGPNWP